MTSSTKSKNSGFWPLQLSITKTLKHEDFHIFQIWVSVYSLVMDQCTWNQRIYSGPSVRSSQKVRKKSRHGPVQVEGFQHLGGFWANSFITDFWLFTLLLDVVFKNMIDIRALTTSCLTIGRVYSSYQVNDLQVAADFFFAIISINFCRYWKVWRLLYTP